jgi:hypothetical protein
MDERRGAAVVTPGRALAGASPCMETGSARYACGMLDWVHRLALTAVSRGDADVSPALENLIACGLVTRSDNDGRLEITGAGRAALEASEPSRLEAWSLRVAAVGLVGLALGTVLGWVVS